MLHALRVPGFARGVRQFLTHAARGREPCRVDRHLALAFTPQRYVTHRCRRSSSSNRSGALQSTASASTTVRLDHRTSRQVSVEHPDQLTLVAGLWPHLSRDGALGNPHRLQVRALQQSWNPSLLVFMIWL